MATNRFITSPTSGGNVNRFFNRLEQPALSNADMIRTGGNVSGIRNTVATPSNPVVPVPSEPDITTPINRSPLNFDLYQNGPNPGAFDLGGGTPPPAVATPTPTFDRGNEAAFQEGLGAWLRQQGGGYYAGAEQDYQSFLANGGGGNTGGGGIYGNSPTLTLAEQIQADAARELGVAERTSAEKLAAELSQIDAEQNAIFAPRNAQLEREGDRARETGRRGLSFAGFGKSSRAIEEEERLNEQLRAESGALAAEQSAAIRYQRALAEGASEDALSAYQNNLSNAKLQVTALKEERAKTEEGLNAASIAAGQASEKDRLDRRVAALESAGLVEDPDTGERIATLKARAQALDETIGLGGLEIDQGEFAIKQAKFPLEFAKLQAAVDKLNQVSTGPGTGDANLNINSDGSIATDINPDILNTAATLYRNSARDTQLAIESAGDLGLGTGDEGKIAEAINTLARLNDIAANEGVALDYNPRTGLSYIKPQPAPEIAPEAGTSRAGDIASVISGIGANISKGPVTFAGDLGDFLFDKR